MRILVVYKKSFLEAHAKERRLVAQLGISDRARFRRADLENRRVVTEVTDHLDRLGVAYDAVYRGDLASRRSYDLVVSLGGDGTFFAAAQHLDETPILGVNSNPSSSLGLWTCADRRTFREALRRALEGRLPATRLWRMIVSVNGRALRQKAFNDTLFGHRNPAAMTRYRLEVGGREEDQKSSGVWVSTAAGSTAGIRSAGGRRMPLSSRRLQYLVREPYLWPRRRCRLRWGFTERLRIVSFVVGSSIWMDGIRLRYDLKLGDRVELEPGAPLTILGYDDRRRRALFP